MIVSAIITALLLCVGFTRVGVRALRSPDGSNRVILKIGFLRFDLLKRLKKTGKPEKKAAKKTDKAPKKRAFSFGDFRQLFGIGRELLSKTVKAVRIDRLNLNITIGGDDPCDMALLYGRLHMVWGIVQPLLDNNFNLKKQQVNIGLDYELEKTSWSGDVALTFSIGRMTLVALSMLGAFSSLMKKRAKPVEA